ncbi:Hypothetical predicted protein [Mytilus galloprovincialis]|uniref:Reverse transcriptase domain-containing protein n=1 Tax=Mytilus galloprovincialis TaxID=29158 RepID=A0A8B6D3E0_MYTGA|nr:Hypothetical predicted protein [Mytilus galloprovincialis]
MASALPVFPPFSVHESAADQRWKKWTKRLQNLLVGMNIKDKVRQRALLLHYAGEEVNDIFDTLQETGEDYDTALTKLTEYFAPKKNVEYEIYKFRQAKQETNETMDAFHTKLRQLSVNCEFNDDNREVKSQIVQGCSSSRLRRKALREDMTLEQLLSSARALELSERQANEIENKEEKLETNALHKKRNFRKNQPRYLQQDKRPEQRVNDQRVNRNNKCRNCGGEFPHRGKCPAQGKSCNFCKKPNHFEKMCRSKRNNHTKQSVNTLENSDFENNFECQTKIDSSSDDEYVFGLQAESLKGTVNSIKREQPRICVKINESDINVLIDTGSSINVIDEDTYNRMKRKPKLIATKTKVFAYGSHQNLEFVGKFDTVIETRNKLTRATVYVSKGTSGNLLCYDTSLELQIIPQISRLSTGNKHEQLCEQYKDIFHGLGKLKETQVKIHVDKTVKPIVQPHRRIPFHIRKQVETELERLERLDIIERVHGPTPWVSPIVVAPKPKSPGEIRICVDMRLPNQAIQRERHITPTIDDLIVDLNGAKVFSKMDLLNGYHQLELTQESRNITTFTTHVGLRRYKRLSFGVTSAAEIFQNTLSTALEGLNGVRNISDDIIVFGASQDEHDTRLTALFQRINEKGLTLNKKKCEFNKDSLEFYGHIFSSKGISADPRKS